MSMALALKAAEERSITALMQAHPGTVTIGETQFAAAVLARRGAHMELDAGLIQERRITVVMPSASIAADELINRTTGATRTRIISHLGTDFEIDSGGVEVSPHGVYFSLKASQKASR